MVAPVSVAEKVGVVPATRLLLLSLKMIVTVEMEDPSAITGEEPLILDVAATATSAMKVTVPPALVIGPVMESVFTSAIREEKVQVEIPEALVDEQEPELLVEPVSVAEKVGVVPTTALLFESFSVIVTVEVVAPFATTGPVPLIDELTWENVAPLLTGACSGAIDYVNDISQ